MKMVEQSSTSVPLREECSRVIKAFQQGLEHELMAQKQQARATDMKLVFSESLESEDGKYRACFVLERTNETVLPGVDGKLLAPDEQEWEIKVQEVDGTEVVLASKKLFRRGEFRLSLSPWFLFERLDQVLNDIPEPESNYSADHALQAFGLAPSHPISNPSPNFPALNAAQNQAISTALAQSCSRIWGPPGTGKTTTLAVLMEQLIRGGKRVLLTSNTHAALDQVLTSMLKQPGLEALAAEGRVIRMGRCLPEHRPYSLTSVTARLHSQLRERWEHCQQRLETLKERLEELRSPLEALRESTGPAEQLSLFGDSEVPGVPHDWAAGYFPGQRGVRLSREKPHLQLVILERYRERVASLIRGYRKRRARCREQMSERRQHTVSNASVVLSTLANLTTSPWLSEERFQTVVVEEAGMALLPALFSACARAQDRTVIVGDPKQLPSILVSRSSFVQRSIGRNIFDLRAEAVPTVMLDTQYRMHPDIGALVSNLSYEDRLKDGLDPDSFLEWSALDPLEGKALAGFELSGASECQRKEGGTSRFNEVSAGVCIKLAIRAANAGFREVAIITPYREQVRTLQKLIEPSLEGVLECDTVHRFQGKERQVVILDLVDGPALGPGSLLRGSGGAAAQLLNVALSRAQHKLFVVGELTYLYKQSPDSFAGRVIYYLLKRKWLYKVKP